MTHGPAIRKSLPEPIRMSPIWKEVGNNLTKNHFTTETQRNAGLCGELKRLMLPSRYFFRTVKHLDRCTFFMRPPLRAVLIRSRNESTEQRMRLKGLRFEFRVELASDEMRMIGQFDHFDVSPVGRGTGDAQP